jgi:glutamyl/glutaminyl-tRNA synthetase
VLLKSDKFPTYHLANVIDDHLMDITHVIRGEVQLSSQEKEIIYIYCVLCVYVCSDCFVCAPCYYLIR